MKRRITETDLDHITMANCLILLSRSGAGGDFDSIGNSPDRVFECKTCNRRFPSFQALGGHRASHKKPKLIDGGDRSSFEIQMQSSSPPKAKSHECSICGLEFAIGQALGGHMRRHRAAAVNEIRPVSIPTMKIPVVKKSNSRRVLCLDLNLTPSENDLDDLDDLDDLEFCFGKKPPVIDCFL